MQLDAGESLSDQAVRQAVDDLVAADLSSGAKAAFLTALARKGESVEELGSFARALLSKSVQPRIDPGTRSQGLLDVCGTGGDTLQTFNISTTAAIVLAAAGVTVAKHGNRAVTSRCGSADVLEALGIPIDLTPELAAEALRSDQFAFFFAPLYHPAFRHISAARKLCAERGQRTIFNLLGPLLNPARPNWQLAGVPRPALCETLARTLQQLGAERGMIVCGRVGEPRANDHCFLDELSTLGETTVAEFYHPKGLNVSTLSLDSLPIQPATLSDLRGGAVEENARLISAILDGSDRGPRRDAVLLNAAAGLLVAGRVKTLTQGWEKAADCVDSGQARAKLASLRRRS